MCELCRIEEKKERIKRKNPKLYQYIDDHNALWQAALAAKINIIHFMEEADSRNVHSYYDGNIFEAMELMAEALNQIEVNSYKAAREGINSAE